PGLPGAQAAAPRQASVTPLPPRRHIGRGVRLRTGQTRAVAPWALRCQRAAWTHRPAAGAGVRPTLVEVAMNSPSRCWRTTLFLLPAAFLMISCDRVPTTPQNVAGLHHPDFSSSAGSATSPATPP